MSEGDGVPWRFKAAGRVGTDTARAEVILRRTVHSTIVGLPAYLFAIAVGVASWAIVGFVSGSGVDPASLVDPVGLFFLAATAGVWVMGIAAYHAAREVRDDA